MERPLPIFRADFCSRSNTIRSIIFVSPNISEAIQYLALTFGQRKVLEELERITKL